MENYSIWNFRRDGHLYAVCLVIQFCCLGAPAAADLTSVDLIGKPTWESTPLGGYPASNAIDGNINTFSHTKTLDPHPWWKLDLLSEHCLGRITVVLRLGCCGLDRFITAVARAGLSSNVTENAPCGSPATAAQSAPGSVNAFPCEPPRAARYVSLDIDASHPATTDPILMLAEVSVDELPAGECPVPTDPTPAPRASANATSATFKRGPPGATTAARGAQPAAAAAAYPARSALRCAAGCLKLAGCSSFDYAPGTGQCRLHGRAAAGDTGQVPHEDFTSYVSLM